MPVKSPPQCNLQISNKSGICSKYESNISRNQPNKAKSNNRPARNKYKYFESNNRRRPNIFAPMTMTEVAELYEQLKTADDLLFWSYMPNNTQPALYNLVSLPPKCACCMLSIICTLGACNKSCQKKTNTKYEYKSNIAQNPLANKYFQIRPNQILAFSNQITQFLSKYESNFKMRFYLVVFGVFECYTARVVRTLMKRHAFIIIIIIEEAIFL